MWKCSIYLLILLFNSFYTFSQDVTVKKDTLNKLTDIIEVNSPDDEYAKFSLQFGSGINSSYSNVPRKETSGKNYSNSYIKEGKNVYNGNINIGFNFVIGSNPYVKFLIGLNYQRSEGNFLYLHETRGNSTYTEKAYYNSKADFINISSGIRIFIGKHFRLDPLLSFNYMAHARVKATGESTTTTYNSYNNPPLIETVSYKNETPRNILIENTISFCPRLQYEFKVNQKTLGIFLSYNIGLKYRLPWLMSGITIYPFKK